MLETVIWDFNGTLIDDLDLVVRSVNTQLAKRNLPSLEKAAYKDVFGFPVQDYYRRIGVTFETETMADLSADFFSVYAPALKECPLHDGALNTLQQFQARGLRQFVLSAMEEGMLRSMIEYLGIQAFFEGVYGLSHQKADSKVDRARELQNAFNIDSQTALFIGDTMHDAEVAEDLGMSVALISLGHQSAARLQETGLAVYPAFDDLVRAVLPGSLTLA